MPTLPNNQPNHRPKRAWVFLAGILVGVLGHKLVASRLAQERPHQVAAESSSPSRLKREVGPWGTLDVLRIPLEDPADFFPDRNVRLQPAHWFFEGYTDGSLSNFFDGCEIAPGQKAELLDVSRWQASSNGWLVTPSEGLVRNLSGPARERIYEILARSPQNYPQQYPFRFRPEDLPARLAESDLHDAKLQLLQQLLYTNAGTVCFSDVQLLPSMLSSNELESTITALYAIPTYRLRLRIYPDSDIEPILRYWARGDSAARLRPLLESLTRLHDTNGTSINISYLMPSFPRLRLYTFPKEWRDPLSGKEDCFWTSLNFFNEEPDKRFLDPNFVRTVLHSDYSPVQGQPTYGDLITLVGPSGDGRHMCVYLADNFVFTKNGRNPLAPWVMMKLPDMLTAFTSMEPQRMIVMRRKEASAKENLGASFQTTKPADSSGVRPSPCVNPKGKWCLAKPGSAGVSPARWPDDRTKPAGETPALPGLTAYLSAIHPLGWAGQILVL